MEEQPQTRDAILERFQRAAEALDAAIAPLSDEQLLAKPAGGGWSKRDILAHIAADQRWLAAQLTAHLEDRPPSADECYAAPAPPAAGFDMSTQDGRNAFQHEMHKDQPLDEIRTALVQHRERIIELARQLPEGDFTRPFAIVDSGFTGQVRPARDGEQGFPLWQWLRGSTWHHYEDHLADLQD